MLDPNPRKSYREDPDNIFAHVANPNKIRNIKIIIIIKSFLALERVKKCIPKAGKK